MSEKTPLQQTSGQKPVGNVSSAAGKKAGEDGACDHCGALVYGDSVRCGQCKRFPIRMRQCPRCKSIAAANTTQCWKCRRVFDPDGDYL